MSMQKCINNAYQQYCRSRPAASADSNKRVKTLPFNTAGINIIFKNITGEKGELTRESILDRMKDYRPNGVSYILFLNK